MGDGLPHARPWRGARTPVALAIRVLAGAGARGGTCVVCSVVK